MTTTQEQATAHEVHAGSRGRRTRAVLLAVAGGLAVWGVSGPLLGIDLSVGSGADAREVGPVAVAVTSLVAGLAAVGLARFLERRSSRPRTVWTAVAASVLVASHVGPLGAATVEAGVALAAMHLVVGGVLLAGLTRTLHGPCTCP